jgi:hypothetical protein
MEPSETLVFQVVREDGRPLGGAKVVVPFEAGSQSAIAGLDGRATFTASPGEVRLVTASRSDFMPEMHDVALDPGTRRFVVPTRTNVEGRVTVGDRTPTEPIRIGLSRLYQSDSLFTHSDAEGRVEFFNLPAGFRGCFSYPSDYWRDHVAVFPPPGDWEVGHLQGATKKDIPITPVNPEVLGLPGDVEAAPIQDPAPPPDPSFSGLSGTGSGLWPLVEAVDAPNEIRLYRTREIDVVVWDPDGKPLAKANVSAPIGKASTSYTWTGDDGLTHLRVPLDAGGLWLSESIRVGPGTGWPQDRVETVSIIIDLTGHETATVRVVKR